MDKYVKIKKIGEGSFGLALLVRSKENGKQMVVKEINMSRMGHKEREEARKETAVLAQLQHPNIVTYRESFEEIGNLYIVMDYCDGGDLYSRINQCRGLLMNEDLILDWFVQICLSIKHIHDRKILHRDIKSQNIFMTKHGIIKLGDFGIAKVLNSTVELARTCIGTPYYLSPEIVENKPYNNKSDIWSLGCVLYEMTTLKHAFEAGNMKNLVLKIIRGSYPPVPPKYSYELRSLIAQLFKRNARDRPSINAVLRKPLLQNRIKKFLTENEFFEEFSHTIMHGKKLQKALPPGLKHPIPVKATPVPAKRPPSTPKYNPASVYGQPIARKSKEAAPKMRKSSEARKSAESARRSAEARRPAAAGYQPNSAQSELAKRKQELIAREKVRREQARLREQQYARRQKELLEKQKQARMVKAREEGWKNLLDSDDVFSYNKPPSPKREERKPIIPSPVSRPSVQAAAPVPSDRGQYEHYHAFLDKLEQDRKASPSPIRPSSVEPPGAHGAGAPVPAAPVVGVAGALGGGAYAVSEAQRAAQQGQAAGARGADSALKAKQLFEDYYRAFRARGADAAKKAKILEEYQQRKREAAMNKARGHGAGAGGARPQSARDAREPGPAPQYDNRPVSAREAHRQVREQEYLSRLKQIRLQNFNERRSQNDKVEPAHKPPSGQEAKQDHDVRKKKIEALRAQADERAQRLKADLDRKRREAYELEQQRLKAIAKAKAAPVIPMTDAMKAIGAAPNTPPPAAVPSGEKAAVGMTTAMEAIGAGPSVTGVAKSPLQKKKEEILKRLNSKPQASKWGKPVEPLGERPKWAEGGESGDLSRLDLEATASNMEATSVADSVVKYPGDKPPVVDPPQPSARRQWGGRAGTVINAMEGADLMDAQASPRDASQPSTPATPTTPSQVCPLPAPSTSKSATIVLSKGQKATQILPRSSFSVPEIKSDEEKEEGSADPVSAKDEVSKLFERVQLDEEAEDDSKDQTDLVVEDLDVEDDDEESDVSSAAVKEGLCTGQFDIGDVNMLRTCSEPDLSRLFRTTIANNPFFNKADDPHSSFHVTVSDEDDDEEEEEDEDEEDDEEGSSTTSPDGPEEDSENETTGPEEDQPTQSEGSQSEEREDEEETSTCEDEDEDDLATMRESMMVLLEDDEEEAPLTASASKSKKTVKKTKKKFKKKKGRTVQDMDSSGDKSDVVRSESVQDFMTMKETMRDVLKTITASPVKKTGSGDSQSASSKDELEGQSTIVPGRESWQSDDEDDDYFEDDDDTFSRLEETRARLEQELGCDTFLKAYKNLQAIHEDEDENMEEGFKLVKHILGEEKANLYPSILQLVMADGAFMEDNG